MLRFVVRRLALMVPVLLAGTSSAGRRSLTRVIASSATYINRPRIAIGIPNTSA